jgi:protein-disulfide isomerase
LTDLSSRLTDLSSRLTDLSSRLTDLSSRLTDLSSAPLPGLSDEDHVRGPAGAPVALLYADFECPYCAAAARQLEGARLRLVFRHFPVRSSHPRAWAAACAAEAAALQGRFWEMHDLLFADQGRLEDPHLWARARTLGLDLERFDADRRCAAVQARVRRDFESGVRGGVVTTPTLVAGETIHTGRIDPQSLEELSTGRR